MFKVKSVFNGHVYTVYAVSGTMFLVWDNYNNAGEWKWMDMSLCRPVTMEAD